MEARVDEFTRKPMSRRTELQLVIPIPDQHVALVFADNFPNVFGSLRHPTSAEFSQFGSCAAGPVRDPSVSCGHPSRRSEELLLVQRGAKVEIPGVEDEG